MLSTPTLTQQSPELRAARARYQDDLAQAEEHYAASLRGVEDAQGSAAAMAADDRATNHRARAKRIRRGDE